jgi:WD40 repeat protein
MKEEFDIFLSYSSQDNIIVEEIAKWLQARRLRVWVDKWVLRPGFPWQEGLEAGVQESRAVAICVGAGGLGNWQEPEMRAALARSREERLPVIPVLLPGCPESPRLSLFLKGMTWVDLRSGLSEEGLERLVWGITGENSWVGETVTPVEAAGRTTPRRLSPVTHTLGRSSLSALFHNALAVTPDGTFAVSAANRHLQLWDLVNFSSLRLLEAKEARPPYPRTEAGIGCISVDATGSRALIGSRSHGLILIDLNSLKYLKCLPEPYVYGAAVSTDWSIVAVVTERNKILIWDLNSEQRKAEMAVPTKFFDTFISKVAIADRGGVLLTSCDSNLIVWELKSGTQLRTLYGHRKQITRVMVTRDARLAVSASNDKTLKLWEPLDGRELCSLEGHTDAVNDVAITPDGRLAASASEDKTVKVWDLRAGSEVCTLRGSEPMKTVCVTENGMRIVGLGSKYLTIWDL